MHLSLFLRNLADQGRNGRETTAGGGRPFETFSVIRSAPVRQQASSDMKNMDEWLGSLGLSEYLPRFEEHAVDLSIVGDLTDADLKDIGIPLGHRRKLLRAIAELGRSAAPLAPPSDAARDVAERRQLTVLFCDMVGSTALSVKLDPEDLRTVISGYQSEITQVIRSHQGVRGALHGRRDAGLFRLSRGARGRCRTGCARGSETGRSGCQVCSLRSPHLCRFASASQRGRSSSEIF